jgi:hypothetical protein
MSLGLPQKRTDTVGEIGSGSVGAPRVALSALALGGSGQLRAKWQGSEDGAIARDMPASGQLENSPAAFAHFQWANEQPSWLILSVVIRQHARCRQMTVTSYSLPKAMAPVTWPAISTISLCRSASPKLRMSRASSRKALGPPITLRR